MYRNVSINVIFIRNVYYIHLKIRKKRCSSPRLSKYFIFSLPNYCSIKNYTYLCTRNHKGAIAQLVEQRTENPCVPGSIPGGTTFRKRYRNVAQLVAHYVRDVGVGRSSRLIPTFA